MSDTGPPHTSLVAPPPCPPYTCSINKYSPCLGGGGAARYLHHVHHMAVVLKSVEEAGECGDVEGGAGLEDVHKGGQVQEGAQRHLLCLTLSKEPLQHWRQVLHTEGEELPGVAQPPEWGGGGCGGHGLCVAKHSCPIGPDKASPKEASDHHGR